MSLSYQEFLSTKITIAERSGFEVDPSEVSAGLKPHQLDAVVWAAGLGKAMIAMSFGLGKSRIQIALAKLIHERTGKPFLIVCPLGVKHQFADEDGPAMATTWKYVRNDAEIEAAETPFLITNYERVRDGGITQAAIDKIGGVSLDEGSVLRSLSSDTSDVFKRVFKRTQYKFVCTATPAPNEYKEMIYYAEFLGVMDHGQALTRFFKRDSEHAGHLTIMPSQEENFWMWVSSWALFMAKPSDLGYSDDGYSLPELRVHWHRLSVDHTRAWEQTDDRGQRRLLLDATGGVSEASHEKKATLSDRVKKMLEIMAEGAPDEHWLLWHHLEIERQAIERAVPAAVTVFGSQELETREERILQFSRGEIPILATKPEIAGSGCNFQRFCHSAIYLGIDYKFQDFIQSVHRLQRFLQNQPVDIHIIYAESEDGVVNVLKTKWAAHNALIDKMQLIIKQYGLSTAAIAQGLGRKMGVHRVEVKGNLYTAVNADCVQEVKRLPDNSIDLWHTSIPFGNHYEYSIQYEDFGHNPSDASFWDQMDFLIPDMLRTLKPGRIAAIHVKDRQLYGHQTRSGIMETAPFSDQCTTAFMKHGFTYQGRRTIMTDVVRENNSTYRLSYGEMLKDASKMSQGLPEYMLLFRKPPTSRDNARADEPITKRKPKEFTVCTECGYALTTDDMDLEMSNHGDLFDSRVLTAVCPNCQKEAEFTTATEGGYSLGRWQIDAHGGWRSSGNRLLSPSEMVAMYPLPETIGDLFRSEQLGTVYDYERHVQICEALEKRGRLPKFFMLLPPKVTRGPESMIWDDVVFMRTLNSSQSQGRREKHLCPLPFDIVERTIRLYSNEGELVGDPFGGLMTVAERAIRLGRRAWTCELSGEYFASGTHYCQAAEQSMSAPTLFQFVGLETP